MVRALRLHRRGHRFESCAAHNTRPLIFYKKAIHWGQTLRIKAQYKGRSRPVPLSKHHVPPRCYRDPDTFVIKIPKFKHDAYHRLLGIPASFDEARRILTERRDDYLSGQLPADLAQHLRILFTETVIRERGEEMEQILLEVWWTRPRTKRSRRK